MIRRILLFAHIFLSIQVLLPSQSSLAAIAETADVLQHNSAIVTEVRVEGLRSLSKDELLNMLGIEPGGFFNESSVQRGIKRAFQKGVFEDIAIETDEEIVGLIHVRVKERAIVHRVKVRGNRWVGLKFIRESFGLKRGDIMRHDLLEAYSARLLDDIKDSGFPDATLSVEVNETRKPYKVNILLHINEGKAQTVRDIKVQGRPEGEILPYLKITRGSIFNRHRLDKGIEEIKLLYRKKRYLNASVGPYSFSDGVFHINVDPGKKLKINIKGNNSIRTKLLMRTMPFFEAREIRPDLIDEAKSKITSLYQSKGYPNAQVATVQSEDDEDIALNFYVYEGAKVKVGAIEILGTSVPEQNLKKILMLRERAVFNASLLRKDRQTIKDFYDALGYIKAEVSEPEVEIDDSRAFVSFDINEGDLWVISDVKLLGNEALPQERILESVRLEAGIAYNDVDVNDARRRIIGLYRGSGYESCTVEIVRQFDEQVGVSVTFVINEGPKMYFGKTIITGNIDTNYRLIRRELTYEEGRPFDRDKLMESRQGIYKTGLFSEVNVETIEQKGDIRDVVVRVKEGKPGSVEFGAGWGEYDLLRGFVDVSYDNLFGMNRKAAFRTELSSLKTRYQVNYREPWFLGYRMPLRAFIVWENRRERNIDTDEIKYRVERTTAGVGLGRNLSEVIKADLLYEFSLTETFDVQPDIIISKEDLGTLKISSITPSITLDTRNSPFDPQSGLFAGVSLEMASYLLFSETDYLKLVAYASRYLSLTRGLVLATSVRGGIAQGLRDTTDLPLIKRFFLGGRNTVRGYLQDNLGPKGPLGNPTGGNVFLLGNVELRIAIAGNWRIVPFVDMGQVWVEKGGFDINDLRYTAGVGLQYNTPIGPIRLDYGHKINRQAGERSGALHFSIGHAF